MNEEHPFKDAAECFLAFEADKAGVELSSKQRARLVGPLQELIERVYAAGREGAHHELVCELEGGSISSRKWPQ